MNIHRITFLKAAPKLVGMEVKNKNLGMSQKECFRGIRYFFGQHPFYYKLDRRAHVTVTTSVL